jgi:chemotaxis protein methyltransferase CheR
MLLIRAFANQGKLTEAIKSCEKAITSNKIDPRLHYLYATILQENNQPAEAVISLKCAIYLDPDFVLSYYLLGNIYQRLGNIKNAKKYFEIVLSILNKSSQEDILFESEGLTAGRFREIINVSLQAGVV